MSTPPPAAPAATPDAETDAGPSTEPPKPHRPNAKVAVYVSGAAVSFLLSLEEQADPASSRSPSA